MITKDLEEKLKKISKLSLFDLDSLLKTLRKEVLKCCDEIKTDPCGNLHFCKKGTGKKIQIIFQSTPTGILLGNQKENTCTVSLLGKKKAESLMHTTVYYQENPIGILRPGEKDEEKMHLETFSDFQSENTEIAWLKNEFLCKDDKLYGFDLDFIISLILADFLMNKIKRYGKCINFTVWNASLNGENGALAACKVFEPDVIILLSGIESQDGCQIGEGPAAVLKDGCFVAPKTTRELLRVVDLPVQTFLGKTDRTMELLSIDDSCKQLLGFYLPIQYENTRMEKMDYEDIEKTQNLLLKLIDCL